jgi:ornithine cyclodeaminase/alanine dehydrogenase-like protein (mu-crystallin family)
MLILSAADVRRALPMPAAIATQRRAFTALATGEAVLPLRTPVPIPAEEAVTLFMPARVGDDLGAKVVSVFPRNPARGLEMVQGVVLLVDTTTGRPLALMDATQLTALRTGAVSGLATDLLARPDARTAAILGSGVQAATQLLAVCAVRPIEHVRVFSRSPQRVAAFIERMQPEVRAVLLPAATAAEAVRDADVVCAATTSTTPVLAGADLRAGAHVNGVGSYTTAMQEVDEVTVRRAGRVFVDNRDAALAEAGDVVIPLRRGLIREDDLVELGSVLAGVQPGRTSAAAVTFFKSVGLAVQDVAAGAEVLRRARELGLGVEVPL